MLNSVNCQRALRPEGPTVTTPALRRTGKVQTHSLLSALRQSGGARNAVFCNAQSFGRGQPPNQPQPISLVRRPFYDPIEPIQPLYVKLSELMDKDVISSTTGRKLGKLGEAWVDASRLEVTCFDLEINGAIGVVPLLTIKQVGDVVLVQEDGVLRQPLDSRFGFTKLLGWEVRTPSNRALGKVRDMAFSRETGTISKIEFDDFGLRFLRADFFDRFSVSADAIRQCAYGIVSLAADNVQYQEKQGLLSSLLRRVGGAQQLAGLLADGSRGSEAAGLLPQGYSYEQWQNDVRMWEAQTGCSYEDYMMQSGQQQPYGLRRGSNALPPGRPQQQALLPEARQPGMPSYALPPATSSSQPPQTRRGVPNPLLQQQQQQQQQLLQQQLPQAYGSGQQLGMYGGGYGSSFNGSADPRFRGATAAQQPQRVVLPQTRYPPGAGPQQQQQSPQPLQQQQQQQWPQPGVQQGQQQWNQQPMQQQIPRRPMPGAPAGRPVLAPGIGAPEAASAPAAGGPLMQSQGPPQSQAAPPPAAAAAEQQQQQPMQYGWPGPAPGPSGASQPGLAAGAAQQPPIGQNGAVGGGGATRVEEWLAARGPQGPVPGFDPGMEAPGGRPPTPVGAQPSQQAMVPDSPGWDVQGAAGVRQPY